MNVKKAVANIIAKTALKNARVACGTASHYGPYQPKEPSNIKERIK